jgi:hypothetical protein
MQAMDVWNSVIDDMEATAEDLADAGWETLVLHPGDVIIATKIEDPGIDTVLPNPEFESLADMVEEGVTFDEYDVFRAGQESMEYALIVAKDTETNTAVLIPLYYQVPDLAEIARGQDMVPIYLRTLEEDSVVLQLTEPGLLLPDSEA